MHLVDSFNKYLLGIYYVSGIVLGAEATSVNKTAQDPPPRGDEHQLAKTDSTQTKSVSNVVC